MSNLVSSPKNVVYVNGGQTYNVSAADDVINVNSNLGATEIVLPNIVNQGLDFYPKKFTVNDSGGVAGTNPITISAVGNIVNSGTSFILNRNNVSSEIVIVSKTEYLVNTDNGGSTGVFGSGVAGQLAYFSASTVLGSLTNAQVTVLIDPMVGDSGSGGLKGLVPAPAAGDAAANKYLKADGTWNAISLAGYLKADGTVPLTANWDVGAFEVTAQSLKVDGTAGAGHFHLRYQSTIPTGAANNSKLFSGATGALGWVVDSNAYAFYLDMTGNTASRTLTVPNASGTIALTTDIVNLGNSNLTSTDDARTFTLKSGGTATQNLQILNSGGGNLLKLSGNSTIDFGSSANYINSNFYCNPATNTNFNVLRGTDVYIQSDVAAYTTYFRGSSWSKIIALSHDAGQVSVAGASAGFFALNNTGTESIIQRLDSNGAYILYRNSANANIFAIDANSAVAGIIGDFGVGAFGPYTARLQVKGSGSTSATTTALFQNSASTNIFKVLDNGNTILNLPSTVAADGDLFNNGVNFYTDGTSLKARYKNNSGTASDLAIGSNIYNTSSTITDDARTVTLKSGGTATQNLAFLNDGGGNLLRLRGDNKIGLLTNTFTDIGAGTSNINFGDTTTPATIAMYFNTNANYIYQAFQMYCGSYKMHNVDGRGRFTWLNSFTGNTDITFTLDGGQSRITTNSFSTSYWQTGYTHAHNGNPLVVIGTENSLHGKFDMYNSSAQLSLLSSSAGTAGYLYQYSNGVARTLLYTTGGNYFLDKLSTGVAILGTISAQFHVKGSGSTSATTTALFENSSSAKSLEILDSGAINIYNSGGFRTAYLNVYGGGVFGGNNNGTIGADPNNVLGGSYLNGIILGGYNNTHNGYQGVIGGGFNTVTTNGTWNFVFSVGSTASAAGASVFGGGSHTASGAYSAVLGGSSNTASGEGSVAVGGNQASASGYRSFAQGYGSSATSDYAVVMGSYCSAVARSARAVGEYCVASGVSSWASGLGTNYGGTGQELKASGLVSFNHSYNDATVLYRAAEGDYSVILGGKNHWTKSGSTSSAILGGEGNTINASVVRSIILGGTGITATASDTAYAININASTLITTPQVITTPATITVAANAGTVTRANRINKFTNSSAATMTITMSTTAALDGDLVQVRIYDFSAATQTITWVNTENSSVTVPATSNGSTTLPLTVGFQYNSATSQWRCIGSV